MEDGCSAKEDSLVPGQLPSAPVEGPWRTSVAGKLAVFLASGTCCMWQPVAHGSYQAGWLKAVLQSNYAALGTGRRLPIPNAGPGVMGSREKPGRSFSVL